MTKKNPQEVNPTDVLFSENVSFSFRIDYPLESEDGADVPRIARKSERRWGVGEIYKDTIIFQHHNNFTLKTCYQNIRVSSITRRSIFYDLF